MGDVFKTRLGLFSCGRLFQITAGLTNCHTSSWREWAGQARGWGEFLCTKLPCCAEEGTDFTFVQLGELHF